jgi:hypothetical protein
MKKRRYDDGGLTDAMEMANSSEESQAIANEDRGDTMLKAMRDEAAKPKMTKPKTIPFAEKAKKANFTSAETGGGAALMYRKPTAAPSARSTETRKKSSGNTVDFAGTGLGMAKGGMTASKRADGCCVKGKTRGKMV